MYAESERERKEKELEIRVPFFLLRFKQVSLSQLHYMDSCKQLPTSQED